MRSFKNLWRLAVDKGLGKSRRKEGPSPRSKPAPTELQELAARLLKDEPPTRTLQ
jgi:hypothetical protein